jgi:hypothetical protein
MNTSLVKIAALALLIAVSPLFPTCTAISWRADCGTQTIAFTRLIQTAQF